jgi:superfamily II DNA helicase RecQ
LINEDNTSTASLWKAAHTTAQLIYISPEMALSVSFTKLWKNASFRKRLQAIVIDEVHCVDE